MTKTPRRLGLDRDRKASHDLIRLLDKPGSAVRMLMEIAFRSWEYPLVSILKRNTTIDAFGMRWRGV